MPLRGALRSFAPCAVAVLALISGGCTPDEPQDDGVALLNGSPLVSFENPCSLYISVFFEFPAGSDQQRIDLAPGETFGIWFEQDNPARLEVVGSGWSTTLDPVNLETPVMPKENCPGG